MIGRIKKKQSIVYITSLLCLILTLAIVMLVIVIYNKNERDNAAFVIDGKYYSKNQIKSLITYPVSVGDTNTTASLRAFQLYKEQTAAMQLGIKLSDSQVSSAVQEIFSSSGVPKTSSNLSNLWILLSASYIALQNQFLENGNYAVSTPQGYSFIFWFGNKLQTPGLGATSYSDIGNEESIETDEAYAKNQAEKYRSQLISNKITPDQLVSDIEKDPKLGYNYQVSSNLSTKFGYSTDKNWETQAYYQSVINYITKAKSSSLSNILTGQTETNYANNRPVYENTFFYIVDLKRTNKLVTLDQFNDKLKSLKTHYYGLQ